MKNKRMYFALGVLILSAGMFAGCKQAQLNPETMEVTTAPTETVTANTATTAPQKETTPPAAQVITKPDHEALKFDLTDTLSMKVTAYDQWTEIGENAAIIDIQGDDVTVTGAGVAVDGRRILISAEGEYVVRGTMTNGQIYIQAGEQSKVHLILDGADLHSDFSAPIVCTEADKLIITCVDGTENTVSDSVSCEDATAKGTIYAACDLTINGKGTLKVSGAFNHGISTDDHLKLYQTTCEVSAVEVAIRGKDAISIVESTVKVTDSDDAMKSNRKNDDEKGVIFVQGGKLDLTANDDGLQATTAVIIKEAEVFSRCIGKSINCDGVILGAELVTEWN